MTREQQLEAALRDMVHAVCGPTGLHEAVKIDTGMSYPWPALDLAEDAAMLALATPPDADTRVVTPDMVRGWLDGFKAALDTAKSITVSVGTVSQADVVGILQSSFDRQVASSADDSRIISTRVVSVDQLKLWSTVIEATESCLKTWNGTGSFMNVDGALSQIRAIIEGKDQ